ncbi:MAG: translocation/assembly module TamB domain-containing protein [Sphingobium sp.]|uniref:translocation/assembly module TamB domain-containing protein n=1 Tax=Sphingobium sp. TaxID=1912891 RepID=UPI0029BD39E3|nr:translocation/assembly module TamB domain-containing protein [Sphingobium sp.]MDX3909768.1 translocation/assembly module TamB domain-containing protein [Sphingobium sp.]
MAEDIPTAPARARRPLWQRISFLAISFIVGLAVLVGALLIGLNTSPGKRFLVKQIAALQLESGMHIDVGRIEGSIYGEMVIRDLALRDPKGVFATSPEVRVDWSPFQYIRNHIQVRSVTSPLIRIARAPQFNQTPTDPNAPWLPDLDIDINRLKIDRLELAPPVTGARRIVAISGAAHIADGRAQINADARADSGDRLRASVDAVPDSNRLSMQGRLDAPAKGIVAAMTGIAQPLTMTLDGTGSWQAWNGKLIATSPKGNLIDVTLAARDGTFTARGPLRPGLVMDGPVARLTSPALALDMAAALAERRVNLRASLRSTAVAATANGLIDLAQSRFGALKINAQLLTPGAIMEKVRGRDVRAAIILDGAFATPFIDYDLTAAQLAFDATGIEGLRATGRAVIDSDRIRIPVTARARRVTGLNAAAGGLLQNLRLKGDFAYASGKLISDNLKIDSDRVDATAIVLADLSNAIYRGALKGRVNDYRVDGVGIVNLTTDVKIVPGAKGGFGLSGRFGVRTAKLDNASVRDFLGGNALVTGRIGMTPEGSFTLANLKGAAPNFTILSGSGRYATNGAVSFDGRATSRQYGPLALSVRGTLDRPQAVLRAARPNVGVQLSNVVAKLNGEAAGYRLEATGGSPYGPFFANVLIRTARGPLIIDISRARFAGVDFKGTLRQNAGGPFAGRLTMNGSGIAGAVQLANAGGVQGVDVDATATNAKVPGDYNIVIGRAIVDASILLYDTPQIVADVQLANTTYGEYVIRQARGKVNYRGGRGTAQLVANGTSGVPFNVAMNAALRPNLYAVALKGRADRVDFRLAKPAIIRADRTGYRLEPTSLVLPQGAINLAGHIGGQTSLQARFKDFDLAIANIFMPGIGVGGTATGTLDFAQSGNAFPTATTRLAIANFTRSSLSAVSEPVAINMEGRLQNGGGDLRALVRRNGTSIGRAVVTLRGASGGSWTNQLMQGSLGGGIRYNGPADVLFSFAGQADQQLTGGIALAADFSGRANDPRFNGLVRANALTYENETFGTRVTNMQFDGRFTRDQLEIRRFNGRAGDGTVQASGRVSLSAANGFPMDIRVALDHARLARSDALGTVVTGNLAVTNSPAAGALVSGDLSLPELRYQIIRQGGAEIRELTGVRRKGEALRPINAVEPGNAPPSLFKLNIRVRADNQIFVTGMGLESEWKTDLRITGTTAAPRIVGQLDVIRGTYSFSGRRFELTKGNIRFGGSDLYNPSIVISASTTVEGVNAILNVTGTAQRPEIAFTSTPSLPQDEVLSRILFGSNVSNLSATQAIQLAAALNSLRGSGGGLNPLGKLQGASGIDRLRILGADKSNGRGTALAAGQYLTNNVYVEIITDARGFTATQLEVALSKALSVLSQTGGATGTSVNVRYSKDY